MSSKCLHKSHEIYKRCVYCSGNALVLIIHKRVHLLSQNAQNLVLKPLNRGMFGCKTFFFNELPPGKRSSALLWRWRELTCNCPRSNTVGASLGDDSACGGERIGASTEQRDRGKGNGQQNLNFQFHWVKYYENRWRKKLNCEWPQSTTVQTF